VRKSVPESRRKDAVERSIRLAHSLAIIVAACILVGGVALGVRRAVFSRFLEPTIGLEPMTCRLRILIVQVLQLNPEFFSIALAHARARQVTSLVSFGTPYGTATNANFMGEEMPHVCVIELTRKGMPVKT
jgi:hypothetical protein